MRTLVVGVLVLLLVVPGAMPASAGAPERGGQGSGGRKAAGAHAGGGHSSGATADQVGGGSTPAARRSVGTRPRPAGQRSAAEPPAAPAAAKTPTPAERNPAPRGNASTPDRKPDATPRGRTPKSTADLPRPDVRSSTVATATRDVSRQERPRHAHAGARRAGAVVTSSVHPLAALFATPPSTTPVVPVQAAVVELESRQWWPTLPGPVSHPAFPAVLAAVMMGFVALGCRGDRRDPKLAVAAIDDRDDRARFG